MLQFALAGVVGVLAGVVSASATRRRRRKGRKTGAPVRVWNDVFKNLEKVFRVSPAHDVFTID